MKKKLNEIFDEIKADELDAFADDLNANDLPPDLLASIKRKTLAKTKLKRNKKASKELWLRLGAIAACFLLIVGAFIAVPMLREDEPNVSTPPGNSTNNDYPGNVRPIHWDDVSAFFNRGESSETTMSSAAAVLTSFAEITSGIYAEYKSGDIISDDYVGEKIDSVVIRTGWHQSWNDEELDVSEVNGEVYKITGIDTTLAVAVRYLEKPFTKEYVIEGVDGAANPTDYFYVFSNPYGCDADSLSGFYDAYDAHKHMSISKKAQIRQYNEGGSAYFVLYNINEDVRDAIKAQLLSLNSSVSYNKYTDSDIRAIESIIKSCNEKLQINVRLTSAGKFGTVHILDNGYIYFTGFGKFFALHDIGSEAAEELIESVKSNSVRISTSDSEETVTMTQPA